MIILNQLQKEQPSVIFSVSAGG
ncbi:uncharacterized protein METZ01_LOCUS74648 [marine metagenome]|uniref:Uncharacterized protein n=1 Tax=marine metagenome TaxID=408172 RepID=A0A381U133_9ZZZZ